MRPVGWSKRSVQLECDLCGSHKRLELWPYLVALKERSPLRCEGCGAERVPVDRRQSTTGHTVERRVAVST